MTDICGSLFSYYSTNKMHIFIVQYLTAVDHFNIAFYTAETKNTLIHDTKVLYILIKTAIAPGNSKLYTKMKSFQLLHII